MCHFFQAVPYSRDYKRKYDYFKWRLKKPVSQHFFLKETPLFASKIHLVILTYYFYNIVDIYFHSKHNSQFFSPIWFYICELCTIYCIYWEEQCGTVVKVFDSGAKGTWFNSWYSPKICFYHCLVHYCVWLVGQVQWITSSSVPIRVTPDFLYTPPWASWENSVVHWMIYPG